MKKFSLLISLIIFSNLSFATNQTDDNIVLTAAEMKVLNKKMAKVETYWVSTLWSNLDKEPITLPIIFKSEKICNSETNELNDITKKTIQLTRSFKCQPVLMSK